MASMIKKVASGVAVFAALASITFASVAKIGEKAPDFTLTDINGKTHTLSDYEGKTVVLEWVNPECPFVVKHYSSGNIPGLQQSATGDGIVWLSINSGTPGAQGDFAPDRVKSWMGETGAAPSAYFRDQDGTVGHLYAAKTTPHMFVITPEGTLVYDGAIDSIASANVRDLAKAQNYVVAALAAVKNGTMPERTQSQPYGCTVKY